MPQNDTKELANQVITQLNLELYLVSSQEDRAEKAKQILQNALTEQEPELAANLYKNISRSIHPDKLSNHETPCVKAFNEPGKLQEILINAKEASDALIDRRTMNEKLQSYFTAPERLLNIFLTSPLDNAEINADENRYVTINIALKEQFPILFKHHEYPKYLDHAASYLSAAMSALTIAFVFTAAIGTYPAQRTLDFMIKITQSTLLNFSSFREAALIHHRRSHMKALYPLAPEQAPWTNEQLDNLTNSFFTLSATEKKMFMSMLGHATGDEFTAENERLFQRLYIPEYQKNVEEADLIINTPYDENMSDEQVADLYNEIRREQISDVQKNTALSTPSLFMSLIDTYQNFFTHSQETPNATLNQTMFILSQIAKCILFTPLALISLTTTFTADMFRELVKLTIKAATGLKLISALTLSAPLYAKDAISDYFSHKEASPIYEITLFSHADMPVENEENDLDSLNGLNASM